MKQLVYVLALAAALCVHAAAQTLAGDSQKDLQQYVPILPSVKAHFWKIDPKLGYAVKSVQGDLRGEDLVGKVLGVVGLERDEAARINR